MAINRLYIIPDINNIEESIRLGEEWNAGFEYNDFFNPVLLDDDKALRMRIDKYKTISKPGRADTLHGAFYDLCINSMDARIRQLTDARMHSSMEIASELGCRAVIFHTCIIPGFEVPSYLDNWVEANAKQYTKLREEYPDIDIYIENMFDYKPDMLVRLAKRMESVSGFGVCYDVAHSNIHNIPMSEWIKSMAPYIRHLHINDNDGTADYHWKLGDGNIAWDEYFDSINKLDADMGLLIETSVVKNQEESLKYLKTRGYIG